MDVACGDTCEVEFPYSYYDTCKYFEEIGPSGCMSDCGGDDKALLNGIMKRCGLSAPPPAPPTPPQPYSQRPRR